MRKVALVVAVGLGAAGLGSMAWGDPLTVNPSMVNSTTALSAGTVTPSADDALTTGPSLPAMVVTPRQATSSQMPADCPSCTNAHFGTAIARPDATAESATGVYGASLTTTLGASGVVAASDAEMAASTEVPSALQLSAIPSSPQTSLGGTAVSDRALTK